MAKLLDLDLLTSIVNGTPVAENLRIDTTAKTIQLVAGGSLVAADGITGQCLFSAIKALIKSSALLISVPLPIREMIHDESMELVNGWTFADTTTLKMIRDCGVAYVNAAGATTAMYACFVTLGSVAVGTTTGDLYFAQDSATNATTSTFTHLHTADSFGVNELVQIYSDTNGDGTPDYDYRGYAKVFLRRAGYTYDESDNTAIGYSALTYKKYNFPITHAVDAGVTVDDTTLDGVGYAGLALQWYALAQSASLGANGPYGYHVIITGASKTHDQIYSWVQRQLRKTTDIDADVTGNRTGTVTPALVRMDGSTLKTIYQNVGGVHIAGPSATSYNYISEQDDLQAYRTYPLSVPIALEFDGYLTGDADSYFWVFATANYGTPGATPLLDSLGAQIKGAATANTSFAFTYSADTPLTGVAMGKAGAKIAVVTTTLTNSGAKLVFTPGAERWYVNPV